MNTNQFEGKLNQLQGNVKLAVGQVVKSNTLRKSGAKDKVKGILQEDLGDAQEKLRAQAEKLSDKVDQGTKSIKAKSEAIKSDIEERSERLAGQIKEKTNQYIR